MLEQENFGASYSLLIFVIVSDCPFSSAAWVKCRQTRGESDVLILVHVLSMVHNVECSSFSRSIMFNVLVVGQTGCGKSSVVNLIAGQNLAPTSQGDDLGYCTDHCTEYLIPVDHHQFQVFDTFGFLDPKLDSNMYTKAIAETYRAICILKAKGGIDMLLYCIRDDEVNNHEKMKSYYRLFREVLCGKEIPIAFVVTNRGNPILNAEHCKTIFTARNITYFDCICVNIAKTPGLDGPVDTKSQGTVRSLLVKCCEAPEPRSTVLQHVWLVAKKLVRRGQPLTEKQITTLLTRRCKMDSETAALVVAGLNLQVEVYPNPAPRGK